MTLPELRDCVSGTKRVSFVQYRDLNLWYACENGFEFPVPVSDTGTGIFMRDDKASYFMRWIRKHLDFLKATAEQAATEAANISRFADKEPA